MQNYESLWNRDSIILLGHRGFKSKYPENTLLSFLEAIKNGADGIELDVWLTRDGELVIWHDEDLQRIAGIQSKIKDLTLKEIKSINLGMNQKIPTLEEIFENMPRNSLINVEIKDIDAVEKTLKTINDFKIKNRIMISSFNVDALRKTRKLDNEIIIGLLIDNKEILNQIPSLAKELSLYSVNIPIDAVKFFSIDTLREYMKQMLFLGLRIFLWADNDELFYTENNVLKFRDLVDGIITDDIPRMKNLLNSKNFNSLNS